MIDPLSFNVFYQESIHGREAKAVKEISVKEVLTDIFRGKYKNDIGMLRNLLSDGNQKGYKQGKKNLPAITFGATFHTERVTKDLKSYTKLLVLDIDELVDEDAVVSVENMLRADKYVISCWRSPSNFGLKGLVYLEYKEDFPLEQTDFFHQSAFSEVENYFNSTYGIVLDISGKDVVRTCFVSHDNRLFYNKNFEKFPVVLLPTIRAKATRKRHTSSVNFTVDNDILCNPKDKNKSWDRKEMGQVIKFLKKRNLSITYCYADWASVSRTIACSFTFDIGLKYFIALSMQDTDKYNEVECKRFLRARYLDTETVYSFATILYLANNQGYSARGVDPNRRKIKNIIKYLTKNNLSITFSYHEWEEVGKAIVSTFDYLLGIKYFKLLSQQDANKYDEQVSESFLKKLYLNEYPEYSFKNILQLSHKRGYIERGGVLKTATEPKGEEVVSINSVFVSNNV